jgi:hypothetical protein
MKKIIIILSSVIVCAVAVFMTTYFSYNNKEIRLRAQADAQVSKIEGVHDKMWKTLQQKAQISNEYKKAFAEIYPDIISGRYSGTNDGSLMKWVTEQNPHFDTTLYKDLSQSIEILRSEFQRNQETLIDIVREHKTLCSTYPGIWLIKNTQAIEYEIITSTKSKMVMETKIDNDVNLF